MAEVGITELLEAGVHFGHQTRRWNPKMRRFIYGERGGIYIIDLLKTQALLGQAQEFADTLAHRGGTVLFVGTKKQARDTVQQVAESADMPYVNHRWLGGLLTNFQTISLRIRRLHDLERFEREGQLELLPTRERMAAQADLLKLRSNLGGVKNMQRVPDAMFVIDIKTEAIAVKEAQRLRIPIIGLVDTNCDPDGIDFVIPGNDDAIRSCALITQAIGQVVSEGHSVFRAQEERARQEAEERARLEAEARARREAEEQAQREAEEQAKREAEERAKREAEERAAAASSAEGEAVERALEETAAQAVEVAEAVEEGELPPAVLAQAQAAAEAAASPEAQAAAEAAASPEAQAAAEAQPTGETGQGEDAVHHEAETQADAELHPTASSPEGEAGAPPADGGPEQGEDAVHAEAEAQVAVQEGIDAAVEQQADGEAPAEDSQATTTEASA